MTSSKDVTAASSASDKWLRDRQAKHIRMVEESIKKLQEDILNSLDILKRNPSGRIMGVKVNLGNAQKIHAKINQFFEKDFNKGMKKVISDFKNNKALVTSSFKTIGEAVKFTDLDETMMKILRDGNYQKYLSLGKTSQDKVTQEVYNSVLAGGTQAELATTIRGALMGSAAVSVVGVPLANYSRLYARDMIMNYHNEVILAKGEQLGFELFKYTGTLMASSRMFCRQRVGLSYTKAQINSWTFKWKGKAGDAWAFRGGYNCRHHWQPVKPEWLKEEELYGVGELNKVDKDGNIKTPYQQRKVERDKLATKARKKEVDKAAKKKKADIDWEKVKADARATKARLAKEAEAKVVAREAEKIAQAEKAFQATKIAEEKETERLLTTLNNKAKAEQLAKEAALIPKAEKVRLSSIQKRSIAVSKDGAITPTTITSLKKTALLSRQMTLTNQDIKALSINLNKTMKIHMNVPISSKNDIYRSLLAEGELKNQFQLGRFGSSGGHHAPTKGSSRDRWEKNISGGVLQENSEYKKLRKGAYMDKAGVGSERPLYGYASDPMQETGARIEQRYGSVTLVLKNETKDRATLFMGNTSGFMPGSRDIIQSSKNNKDLLNNILTNNNISDDVLKDMIAGKQRVMGFTRRPYTESQTYGGLNLQRDVSEIIDIHHHEHVKDLADKWGIKYTVADRGTLKVKTGMMTSGGPPSSIPGGF